MPIYQRTCTECEFTDEAIESINDGDIIKECPKCKKETFKKGVSTGTNFQLKGENWAKDGYTYEYTNSLAGRANKGGKHGTRKRGGD